MRYDKKQPSVTFDFKHSPGAKLAEVEIGDAPREALLGYIQLMDRGWAVNASDDRWHGFGGRWRTRVSRFMEVPSLRMISTWRKSDIIVVVTRFSLVLALIARALGKRLIFFDAMQNPPSKWWRRVNIYLSLKLADASFGFSEAQCEEWACHFKLPKEMFVPLKYAVDLEFYRYSYNIARKRAEKPYLIAVGRDPERDFDTLVAAADLLGWDLKLVTLPYLVPEAVRLRDSVEVLENLSYKELFDLYSQASVAVIPVKGGVTYMSGIRGAMESMALGVPTVATKTSGLTEYFKHEDHLLFVAPDNPSELAGAVKRLDSDGELRTAIVDNARTLIELNYRVELYADELEAALVSTVESN